MEHLEQVRSETTTATMRELAAITADNKQKTADRIQAARVLDAMSDSIIKAYMLTTVTDKVDRSNRRTIDAIDKLKRDED